MNPLAEVFGFPISIDTEEARRYRANKLCPFSNKIPNCTKDKANAPLGVCSILHNSNPIITCPVRFREKSIIFEQSAKFFFGDALWTTLSEVRLNDKNGRSVGNIDYVLISYDGEGKLLDFASLEIQGVYISGNLRSPYEKYIANPTPDFGWPRNYIYPTPDFLSSSRKRLIPQILQKGKILKEWRKKQAIVLQKAFFATFPELPRVSMSEADIAWFLYDLVKNERGIYALTLADTVYTGFAPAMKKITEPEVGNIDDFLVLLQNKLDDALFNSPDTPLLTDVFTED